MIGLGKKIEDSLTEMGATESNVKKLSNFVKTTTRNTAVKSIIERRNIAFMEMVQPNWMIAHDAAVAVIIASDHDRKKSYTITTIVNTPVEVTEQELIKAMIGLGHGALETESEIDGVIEYSRARNPPE